MTEREILRAIQADLARVKTDVASIRDAVSALNRQVVWLVLTSHLAKSGRSITTSIGYSKASPISKLGLR
jgi:hypothetical protein